MEPCSSKDGAAKAHSGESGESGGGERTRTFLEGLDCDSDVEMSTCWKLVGGGRLDEVSIEWRGGKRVEVDEAMPCSVAVSAATTDLRNGLDEAMMSTRAAPRVSRSSFFFVSLRYSSLSLASREGRRGALMWW